MRVIDAQFEPLPKGGILYDAARIRKPTAALFTREFWAIRDSLREVPGGRGSVCFVRPAELALPDDDSAWVLRHYRRGGLVAKVLSDRYFWTGASRTRCFREWQLLAELHRRGLPVPAPVAAKFERSGCSYRADLITVQLPASQTLAALLARGALAQERWHAIGSTIARFHAQGVQHADLNAHNILLDDAGVVFILDFDRGRLRESSTSRGKWEDSVLARLRRSLEKVTASNSAAVFGPEQWQWLMQGTQVRLR